MAGIFISYRRNDSDVAAGRLADDLSEIFGREAIFRDVETLEVGHDYTKALDHALESCVALLAIIGARWATITDDAGHRRLDDQSDWVRLEIRRALERGIRVIPVLIAAPMPREVDVPPDLQPLLKRHAFELSDRHWRQGITLLTEALEKVPGIAKQASAPPAMPIVSRRHALGSAAVVVMLAISVWLGWFYRNAFVPVAAADLSPWVRIRDSGPEGAVAGLAVVMAMEASLARQGRPVTLSARYLYEKARSIDPHGSDAEGTDMAAALYVAETFGAPPEERWPYVAGSQGLPRGMTWNDLDKAAAQFRARTFRLSALEDIPQQLARGRPVLAAANVTQAWYETSKTGLITLGKDEELQGLHAVVIVGFDPLDASIKFANSWSVDWGADGFGRMSEADARKALTELWAIDVPPKGS